MGKDDFLIVSRPHGDCWKHKTQDYWIVFYKLLEDSGKPCFSAYRSTEGCYQRDPWTVNNKCVGRFFTLSDAMRFADNH